jgi:hypothetical protein
VILLAAALMWPVAGCEGVAATHPAGSGAEPPIMVASCASIDAGAGWENISPGLLTGSQGYQSTNVAADPVNSGTVYLGTGSANNTPKGEGLLKSTDCGATWTKVSTGANASDLDQGVQWTLVIDPIVTGVVYTNSGYGQNGLWKSTNGGVDWSDVWPPSDPVLSSIVQYNFVGNLQPDPDPQNHLHLLMTFHAGCTRPSATTMEGCFAETRDGGDTWTMHFGTPPFEAQARVYPLTSATWIVPSGGHLWRTADGGGSWQDVAVLAAGGHSAGNRYHSTKTGYYIGTEDGVIHSADGVAWSLVPSSGQWVKTIVGNGTTMYAATANGVLTSAESDGGTWTLDGQSPGDGDGCFADYDAGHGVLYVSCGGSGVWRKVVG